MIEQWKDIKGLESKYMISSYGRVKSKTRTTGNGKGYIMNGRVLKILKDIYGYSQVNLSVGNRKTKSFKIHRLVVTHFLQDSLPEGFHICHIDGDKDNNKISNLYVGDVISNTYDRYRHNTTKLTLKDIKNILTDNRPQHVIAYEYGVKQPCISRIKTGKRGKIFRVLNQQLTIIHGAQVNGTTVIIAQQG